MEAGLWQRHRKRAPYRQRREPKRRFGEMVQLDGSHHRWFEDRAEGCSCLMSKTTYAFLAEQETTEAAMRLLWGWIERYGIPMSLYCDQKNAYITDREPRVGEKLRPTMELSYILAVSDKTQSVNLKEIEVSDYYLWHIRVIPEI